MLRQHATAITVCAACAASVVGHWWIARDSERRMDRLLAASFHDAPVIVEDWSTEDAARQESVERTFSSSMPRLLAKTTYEISPIDEERPVDALHTVEETRPAAPPAAAKPLTRRQREELAAVREVIEEEMPETSAEERDIWFDELKSLPAEVVRDLLQVRKQLRVLSPDHPLSGPAQLSPQAIPHTDLDEREIPADPVTQRRPIRHEDWSSARQALEQAIDWSTHNLANAATPGFKRVEVLLGDVYDTDDSSGQMPAAGRGCGIQSLRLDLRPGSLQATERNLDLAIDGEGFFIVHDEKTHRTYYTRCGAVSLNTHGQLCLVAGDRGYRLEPTIVLPIEASAVTISTNGTITYRLPDEDEPLTAGTLQLAKFVDASQLKPLGHGLYEAPPETNPHLAAPGSTGMGLLRQGFLEQSNVDPERDQSEREAWESILKTLPSSDLPRTARESSRSPN